MGQRSWQNVFFSQVMNTFVETKKNWGNLFLVLFVKKNLFGESWRNKWEKNEQKGFVKQSSFDLGEFELPEILRSLRNWTQFERICIANIFLWKMFSNNTWSMNFEEIINFPDSVILSEPIVGFMTWEGEGWLMKKSEKK